MSASQMYQLGFIGAGKLAGSVISQAGGVPAFNKK